VGDTVVFTGPPKTEQKLWPAHCIQESWGSEFHKDLIIHPQGEIIHKGFNPNIDSYSAFFDNKKLGKTKMADILKAAGVTDCYVCGIATDVCVASTAMHSLELGFRTILVDDCSRGIDGDDIKKTFERVREGNGLVVQSNEVRAMVQGRDRRVELGYQWAIELRKNIIYPPKNKNCKYNPVIDQSPNQSQDTNGTSAPANGNPETDNSQQPEVTASA